MNTTIRTYRIPILVTLLMVAALAFWAWQGWGNILERKEERQRQHATGVFETIEGVIRELGNDGILRSGQVESVLENLIRNSKVSFVVLSRGDHRILQAGEAPRDLTLPAGEGESVAEGRFLLWRKVRLQGNAGGNPGKNGQGLTVGTMARASIEDATAMMILGIDTRRESGWSSRALRGLVVTMVVGVLFVAATMVAWIMTIRSRLLAGQLSTERCRRAHLEELGLAAAGLAHETKNPLGIILGIAQQIAGDPKEPEQSRVMLEHIMDEVDKASARLGSFMTFARQRTLHETPLDWPKLGDRVAEILRPDFDAAGVKLSMNGDPLMILADGEMLRQVLVNLLLNSLHASPKGSRVNVRMELRGKEAVLSVSDEGCGIEPELLPDIFKPYVAGNPEGHGLGLSIVKRFVEAHGWTVDADSRAGGGTMMTISGIRPAQDLGSVS